MAIDAPFTTIRTVLSVPLRVACLVCVLPLLACTTPRVPEAGPGVTGTISQAIEGVANNGIMFVFVRRFSYRYNADDVKAEDFILACVRDAFVTAQPERSIVSFNRFHNSVFPNLDKQSVPRKPEYFSSLLESSKFRKGLESLGIRYVAFVGGVVKVDPRGGGGCLVGPHGFACFGYWEWNKASHMAASVMDLQGPATLQPVAATALGKAWLVMVGIFPIGLPSRPSDVACGTLGTRVAKHLSIQENARTAE